MDTVIQFKGTIYEQGYGLIAQKVMRDPELHATSKLIYSYICSFAAGGLDGERLAFPSIALQCHELGISEDTYYKYRKALIDKGYLTITKQRKEKAKFNNNLYSIAAVPVSVKVDKPIKQTEKTVKNEPYPNRPSTVEPCTVNSGTNNNILNNNILNNKKEEEEEEEKLSQLTELTNYFKKNITKNGEESVKKELAKWMNVFTFDVLEAVIKQCALLGAGSWKYVERALNDAKASGITNIDQLLQKYDAHESNSTSKKQKSFNSQSRTKRSEQLPDWFESSEQYYGGGRAAAKSQEEMEKDLDEINQMLALSRL